MIGGCEISQDRRRLGNGLEWFLKYSPRYKNYGDPSGIATLLEKGYQDPVWAYKMAQETVKPRIYDDKLPMWAFNSQTIEEQEYFYKQYLDFGEKSTVKEGVYYHWGDVKNNKDTGDMFILTMSQLNWHQSQNKGFPMGGD